MLTPGTSRCHSLLLSRSTISQTILTEETITISSTGRTVEVANVLTAVALGAAEGTEVPCVAGIAIKLRTRPVVVRLQMLKVIFVGQAIRQTAAVTASWISRGIKPTFIPKFRIKQMPHLIACYYVLAGCGRTVITKNIWAVHRCWQTPVIINITSKIHR